MTTGILNDVNKAISLLTEKHSMDSIKINNLSTLLENALTESKVIAGNGITITKNSEGNYLFEAHETVAGVAAMEEAASATATAVAATAVAVAAQTTADGASATANANTTSKQNNLTIINAPASGAGSLALNTNNANLTYTPLDKTAIKFTDLDETPASLSGSGGKHLKVNSGGTALELTDAPISGGTEASNDGLRSTNAGSTVGQYSILLGEDAGKTLNTTHGAAEYAIDIGFEAGKTEQRERAIAIGYKAGEITQGTYSVAIGGWAGQNQQKTDSVAIGEGAGYTTQAEGCISIGKNAGHDNQGSSVSGVCGCVAIGWLAGRAGQGEGSVAIGLGAGQDYQGEMSIAIGHKAACISQAANSIVINASRVDLVNQTTSGLFINPIRNSENDYSLYYNTTTSEITYSSGGGAAVWFRARQFDDVTISSSSNTDIKDFQSGGDVPTQQSATGVVSVTDSSAGTTSTGEFVVPTGQGGTYMLGGEAYLYVGNQTLAGVMLKILKYDSGNDPSRYWADWDPIYQGRFKESSNDGDSYHTNNCSGLFVLAAGDRVKMNVWAKTTNTVNIVVRGSNPSSAHHIDGEKGTTGFWGYKVA